MVTLGLPPKARARTNERDRLFSSAPTRCETAITRAIQRRRYKHRGRVQRVQRSRSPWVMCSLGDVTPRKVSPPREPALSLDPRSILRTHAPVSFLSLALRLASRYCCAALCTPLRAAALHSFVGTYIGNRSNRKWRF